jgi:hypothetical protein
MNWTLVIKEIMAAGYSIQQIADATEIKRTTIEALRSGQNQDTTWTRGAKLIDLLRDTCPDSSQLPEHKVA